jgi:hypothetical protein
MGKLRPQPLPIQFAGGLETKADPKAVPLTKLLDLQNAVFTRATTLAKRNGYEALSRDIDGGSAQYGEPRGLAKRGDELVLFDERGAYSYRPSLDNWSYAGGVVSAVNDTATLARTGTAQWCPDAGSRGGVTAVAWEDSRGGVWMSVLEDGTGRVLLADTQLDADGTAPRVVECGSVVLVLWTVAAEKRIYSAVVNPASASTAPTPIIVTDDLSASNPVYDAEPTLCDDISTDRPAILAWSLDGGGYRVGFLHPTGVLGSPVTGLPSVVTNTTAVVTGPIAVAFDRFTLFFAAVLYVTNGTGAQLQLHEASDLTLVGSVRTLGGGTVLTGVRITCAFGASISDISGEPSLAWAAEWDSGSSRLDLNVVHVASIDSGSTSGDATVQVIRGHVLLSRAFFDTPSLTVDAIADSILTGHVYVTLGHPVKLFPYAAVVRISDADDTGQQPVVARMLPGESAGHLYRLAAGVQAEIRHLPSVEARVTADDERASRQHRIPLSYRIQLDGDDQFSELGIRLATIDFDHVAAYQSAELGRGLYLAGACPLAYDGAAWAEADFHAAPDWAESYTPSSSFTSVNTASGAMTAGTYSYKLWWEHVDAQGEVHSSAVSAGVLVTLAGAGNDSISITVPTCRLTRRANVRLCVARSVVGQTGTDETIPSYRVTGLDPSVTTGNNCFVYNDPTVDTVTFVDGLSDATLISREPLYTTGGILSNDPSPWSGGVVAGGKERVFWRDPSDSSLIRFSKLRLTDTALEGPVDFAIAVDNTGGPIVGLAVMDDALVAFTSTAIYRIVGSGPQADPDAQPEANSFSPAQLITTDVGLKSATSIVASPVGLMFQSQKGIVLLGRDYQVQRIGGPVDGYNAQTVVRATLLPDRPHIIFLTDEGSTLLFDYERGQWSRFTNHEGLDAVLVGGVYHYLRGDGRVFRETPGRYADDNTHVTMLIETAWVKMAGYLQGWQSILWAHFLGSYKSAHELVVRWRIDYEDAWSTPYVLDVNSDYDPSLYGEGAYGVGPYGGEGGASGTVYQRRIHINRRCQSMQFRIEDREQADDFGASFELSELLLIGGVMSERFPLGSARSS